MAYLSTGPFSNCSSFEITNNPSLIGPGTDYPIGLTIEEFIEYFFYGEILFEFDFTVNFQRGWQGDLADCTLPCSGRLVVNNYKQYSSSNSTIINNYFYLPVDVFGEAGLSCSGATNQAAGTSINIDSQPVDTGSSINQTSSEQNFIHPKIPIGELTVGYNGPVSSSWVIHFTASGSFFPGGFRLAYIYQGLIYPVFRFAASHNGAPVSRIDTSLLSGWPLELVTTIPFLGHSLPIYKTPSSGTSEIVINNISISLFRRHPYDPGDTDPYPGKDGSGPVYDSVTGAQLRNPFNIVKRGDGTFYNPNYIP